ncbi:hypothetical protein E4T56_gene14627 [Termitomyces sp. T112]|nr:hypothetical protein E4T56_gene14627 [Termitomyces sp. T112]KAH0579349.1 hypothetical protein H2248_003489 [Termitomyces sp. 'cryptogamus']KNZ76497.1 hypothetical protein J132_10304 [Termitomyces sp. J132]
MVEAEFAHKGGDVEAQTTPAQTIVETSSTEKVPLDDLAQKEGFKLVEFESGKGEDPKEWDSRKKWFITLSTSFLCLTVAIGSSIITGDMEGASRDLHASQEVINLTVSCFVLGFGIGPLFFAPLSEVIGRRPIYCVSIFFFFVFTIPSALAKNAATLVVGRQLAGLAASAPIANVGGTISDIWAIKERGIPMAIFSGTIFLGPCLGPIMGSWIGQRAGWRWIYWVLLILIGVVFALTIVVPETYAPVLLKKKAERLRKETGDDSYTTRAEMDRLPFASTLKVALTRPFIMMVMEPIVLFFSFYLSFVYSLLYLLFFAFPIAFAHVRGWSMGMTGTSFVSIMLGILVALAGLPYQEAIYRRVTKDGNFPEARLYPMLSGCILLPISLFIFAFTGGNPAVHWVVVCLSGAFFGISMILIYVAANSYIIDSYSTFPASAMAAKTLMRSIIGATIPLWVDQMFGNIGIQWGGLLLALISCVITPIPFVFYFYGERIRSKSRMASKAKRVR